MKPYQAITLLPIIVVLIACAPPAYLQPSIEQGNIAYITVSNESLEDLSMARYKKPASCEEPEWLLDDIFIKPKTERVVRFLGNELQTLLFTRGSRSSLNYKTDQLEWCYIAISFTPLKDDHFKFVAKSELDKCVVQTFERNDLGHWFASNKMVKRKTDDFSFYENSPCGDEI
ncbi:hypothetical protein R50072_13550 [Simiduia litorea]|uniref:hypothetical protein n=1 Tax=Simiduia litorea TaxID=1435348 RepID=UPI0036F2F6BF